MKFSKSAIFNCLLSIILVVYLVMAMILVYGEASRTVCTRFNVHVLQNASEGNHTFVTAAEVRHLLQQWDMLTTHVPLAEIDLQAIEDRLNVESTIEHATVTTSMDDGSVDITVTPMIPVARVFDRSGSYYLNAEGKRLTANSRFRMDVPIISGEFSAEHPAAELLPLVQHITADSVWNAIVAQIIVNRGNRDVILVPVIRGHVINLGDVNNLGDKLERVMLMYHKVLPVKGWDYYDTISVKWAGQVVATKRDKSMPEPLIRFDQVGDAIGDEDVESMLVDSPAPSAAPVASSNSPKPAAANPKKPKKSHHPKH